MCPFKLSESFKSVAQGVIEIFEEVYPACQHSENRIHATPDSTFLSPWYLELDAKAPRHKSHWRMVAECGSFLLLYNKHFDPDNTGAAHPSYVLKRKRQIRGQICWVCQKGSFWFCALNAFETSSRGTPNPTSFCSSTILFERVDSGFNPSCQSLHKSRSAPQAICTSAPGRSISAFPNTQRRLSPMRSRITKEHFPSYKTIRSNVTGQLGIVRARLTTESRKSSLSARWRSNQSRLTVFHSLPAPYQQ